MSFLIGRRGFFVAGLGLGRLSWRLCYPALAFAFFARRRIDFAARLNWLLYGRESGAVAHRTFVLSLIDGHVDLRHRDILFQGAQP